MTALLIAAATAWLLLAAALVDDAGRERRVAVDLLLGRDERGDRGDLAGRILSACLADEVGREPLDRAVVANLAHDIAEATMCAYLNAQEAQRQVRAALAVTSPQGEGE